MQNPNELTDEELMSVADDPALKAKLTPGEIGRLSSLRTPRIPLDQRGLPMVTSNTSDAPNSPLLDMLGPLAHPQTLTDFARLLTLPVDSVKKAMAGAFSMSQARTATTTAGQTAADAGSAVARGAKATATALPKLVLGKDRAEALSDIATAAKGTAPASPELASAPGYPRLTTTPAPAAATPPIAAASAPTNSLPNQKLLNELAIAARRAGVKLTPETEQAAIEAVGKGASPMEAVGGVKPSAPAAAAPAAIEPPAPASTPRPRAPRKAAAPAPEAPPAEAPSAAPATKIRLSAPEAKEFGRLLRQGKSEADAWKLIQAQRGLSERLGLPTAEQARQAVADRNASGRWEQ